MRSSLYVCLLTTIPLCAFATPTLAAEPAAAPAAKPSRPWVDRPVDKLGDLKLLRITGNFAFTADTIRDRLAVDPDCMSTGHPTGYLKDYVATLERRITDGYRLAGYHEVEVTADFAEAEKRIDIVVREGKRYRFGEVVIRGNARFATADLKTWLTTPRPDFETNFEYHHDPDVAPGAEPKWIRRAKSDVLTGDAAAWNAVKPSLPVWQTGEFGKFGDKNTADLERLIRIAYSQLGLMQPMLTVQTVARESTVDLLIDIEHEGPRTLIAGFHFVGLKRNDQAELLKLIDVKVGDVYDRPLISRVDRALWHSGRFQNYAVTFVADTQQTVTPAKSPASNKNDAGRYPTSATANSAATAGPRPTKAYADWAQFGKLQITVKESRLAPPLGQDLTAEQQAMLKFRSWLSASAARGDDFSFRFSRRDAWELEVIVSPTKGFLAEWKHRSAQNGGSWRSLGLESTAEAAAIYVFDRGRKLEVKPIGLSLIAMARVYQGDSESQQTKYNFGWGGNWNPKRRDRPTMLDLSARITPAAAVAMATTDLEYEDELECRVVDGVLIHNDFFRTRIEVATGKLLSVGYKSEHFPDSFVAGLFDPMRAEVKVEPGRMAAKQKSWRERTAMLQNEYDPNEPIASALNFILDEPAWDDLGDGEDALWPDLKHLVRLARKARDTQLAAPLVEALVAFFDTNGKDDEFLGDSSGLFARLADVSFPRDSWPWLQTREFGLASLQRSRHTQQALERGAAEAGWGPLAFGCAAAGSKKFEYYYLAEPWAAQGMKRIEAADFERDCRPLVDPKYLSGRLLQATARFVRSLDEAEAEYLIKCTDSYADWATACVKHLRAEPKQPLEAALPTALRKAWNKEVQVRLAGLMSMWLK